MPRIRKSEHVLELSRICSQLFSYEPETSKRATTAHRAKVKRKVVETRKKSKKAAKKDHTWKSSACSYICALFFILMIPFSLREAKRSWHPEQLSIQRPDLGRDSSGEATGAH